MSPHGVNFSDSTNILKTGEAKLWLLLVGVNEYQDAKLPSLRYPSVDCQGLGDALSQATQGFPNKEVIIHNDFAAQSPTLENIRASLERIVSQSQSQDSIVLYFSGHGMLEPSNQQAVLCLADTCQDNLLATGLALGELMRMLGTSSANHQLVCLDTCHSGDMRLVAKGGSARSAINTSLNPAPQVMEVLRQRAAQSKGFCALLSCDQGQQSWEFPELGHGLFTYYLMQGLLGAAADAHGIIEADGLYKYVYRQTLQYIDKLNQQLRLINQQKLARGDSKLHSEYPLQTPKRIVEGVGELILGFNPGKAESPQRRRALIIDGENQKTTTDLSWVLASAGGFAVEFPVDKAGSEVRLKIQEFVRWDGESETESPTHGLYKVTPTSLLYLRGQIEEIEDGEAWLILDDGVRLSRSWLRQELRQVKTQHIIILDFPQATSVDSWIEDLQSGNDRGQCIIAAAAIDRELFSQSLRETLTVADPRVGLSAVKWVAQLSALLKAQGSELHVWLSGTQAVIDILPGDISRILPAVPPSLPQSHLRSLSVPKPVVANPMSAYTEVQHTEIKSQLNLAVNSQPYVKLEKLLARSLGPLAPTLLQRAVIQVKSIPELVEHLAAYVLPQQKDQWKQQAIAILEVLPQAKSLPSSAYQVIDASFIMKCERELANFVGPIASFMINQVLQSQPQISLPEFVNKLSAKIRTPQQAKEFEQRLLEK
jgi:uncharacterized caspase-like protein